MQEENNVELDTTTETVEETEETPEEEVETTEETIETPEVDTIQLQATNKKLFERAKKAEAELKALKAKGSVQAKVSPQANQGVEETVLLANGMPEDLLQELKAVASVRKTTLLKAQNDPIFVAVKEKFEKDKKHKEASLGVSRGAPAAKVMKKANSPGLSREEHMRLAKEAL